MHALYQSLDMLLIPGMRLLRQLKKSDCFKITVPGLFDSRIFGVCGRFHAEMTP